MTAPSGSYKYRPTGRTSGSGSAVAGDAHTPAPEGSSLARRAPGVTRGPNHSTASLTSPPSETHSASASAGIASWGMPGAIFSAARGALRAASTAHDRGGE